MLLSLLDSIRQHHLLGPCFVAFASWHHLWCHGKCCDAHAGDDSIQFIVQGRVLLWDLQPKGLNWIDGRIAGHFRAFDSFGGRVTALAFTAVDSIGQNTDMLSLVAMACSDGTIRVADLADDDYHYTLSIAAPTSNITFQENAMNNWHHMRHNMLAAVSSCGQWLATVGTSNSMEVQVWDAETGTLVKTCLRSSSPIRVVKWSRTGQATQLIATGNATGKCQVYLWTGCEA